MTTPLLDGGDARRVIRMRLAYLVRLLRRRIGLIIVVAVVMAGAGVWASASRPVVYSARTTLLLPELPSGTLSYLALPQFSRVPDRSIANQAELARSEIRSAIDELRSSLGAEQAAGASILVTPIAGTSVLEISASASSQGGAIALANTLAETYVEAEQARTDAQLAMMATEARMLADLAQASGRPPAPPSLQLPGQEISGLADLLEVSRSAATLAPLIIAPAASASTAQGPQPLRDGGFGAVVGLALGALVAVGWEAAVGRVNDEATLRDMSKAPLLGRMSIRHRPLHTQDNEASSAIVAAALLHVAPATDKPLIVAGIQQPNDGLRVALALGPALTAAHGSVCIIAAGPVSEVEIPADVTRAVVLRLSDARPTFDEMTRTGQGNDRSLVLIEVQDDTAATLLADSDSLSGIGDSGRQALVLVASGGQWAFQHTAIAGSHASDVVAVLRLGIDRSQLAAALTMFEQTGGVVQGLILVAADHGEVTAH